MATTVKTKSNNLDKLDIGAILLYMLNRLYKQYIVPNAIILWSTLAVAEATYILVKGIF